MIITSTVSCPVYIVPQSIGVVTHFQSNIFLLVEVSKELNDPMLKVFHIYFDGDDILNDFLQTLTDGSP